MFSKYNKCLPCGSCYSVGAGGHIVGGGYGLLSRINGLTVDWLSGIEIITVNKNRQVQLQQVWKPDDLWWASTGGGGGNFGIITKYFYKNLPSPPKNVILGQININWNLLDKQTFTKLLLNYGEFFIINQPKRLYFDLFTMFKLFHKSSNQITIITQSFTLESLNAFIELLLNNTELRNKIQIVIREIPWLYATQTLNGSGPNQRAKYKSTYMKKNFQQHEINTMYKYLTLDSFTNAQALLQIDSYGGVVNDFSSSSRAIYQRDSILKLQYQVYWLYPNDDSINLSWIRNFYNEMYGVNGPLPSNLYQGWHPHNSPFHRKGEL